MRIRFWGTRGSIPVPGKDTIVYGGNTTCVQITLESGRTIIVDSGTGIRPLGEHLLGQGNPVDIHMLITHIHWDHINGFPFFAPVHKSETKIAVDGAPSCMKGLSIPFESKMNDGFFPVRFSDLKAEISYIDRIKYGPLRVDDVTVDSILLQHPQGGLGFRFSAGKKKFVFITDNELGQVSHGGRNANDYISFCMDADILVHDAQYLPEEISGRRGWGHSDYVAAINLAKKAHVKRLVLFHHDPYRTDAAMSEIIIRSQELAAGLDLVVDAAKEEDELVC
ncbi:Metallo-beta-lactamase family protein [uncultured Desulfobacterium sp.]|uniref:Metallo-beta-lactamase family protein n=1 Tax=uncultured Desulfobacterium sp. TaxID=201089 RepID=A0A445N3E7_9BACT|nr:Metallo-beta-lactamase family protein [uncultured Desulfobacterium sp.]